VVRLIRYFFLGISRVSFALKVARFVPSYSY
jgi:hypothetical protein